MDYIGYMRLKQKNIANFFGFVAEQQLSGCKATIKRVMRQCVKTLNRVISTNHLFKIGRFGKVYG
tara:strand:- start:248 stop:442 length:195 start_codon:yes stop_codon:yes gene_type:complete